MSSSGLPMLERPLRGGPCNPPANVTASSASERVLAVLSALETGDLIKVNAALAPSFQMVFPGTQPMTSVEEFMEWAEPRYRFVRKAIEAVETIAAQGRTVVYVRGTLFGEWRCGTAFSGVRFIDRFEVEGDHILRQDVWNDLAETRPR